MNIEQDMISFNLISNCVKDIKKTSIHTYKIRLS